MSARDELDRALAAWMIETAASPPPSEGFNEVMAATSHQRPRPRWLTVGGDWLGTPAPMGADPAWPAPRQWAIGAAATAVLVVVALAGITTFGQPNDAGRGLAAPSATPTASGSSTPVPMPTALGAGILVLPNPNLACRAGCSGYQSIILNLPAGWATSDGRLHKHLGQPGEVALSAWTVDQVYADPCHWQESALSPLDLAGHSHDGNGNIVLSRQDGGLANQLLRGPIPRAMDQVEIGGIGALRIELSVPPDLDLGSCDRGEFRSWTVLAVAGGANAHHLPGQIDVVYEVDVDRRALVIDASHMPATSEADLAELNAIVASMAIN